MKMIAVFLVVFVIGPLVFRLLIKGAPTVRGLRVLGVSVAALVVLAVLLQQGVAGSWGQNVGITAAGILLMWGAWVGALAFGAQALRRRDTSAGMRRWTGILGALGTTVPWFGLALARMAGG